MIRRICKKKSSGRLSISTRAPKFGVFEAEVMAEVQPLDAKKPAPWNQGGANFWNPNKYCSIDTL